MFFVFINFLKKLMKQPSTFGGDKNYITHCKLPCRRQMGILCFIRKQRIKNPINPVDPVNK
jgi:hypothetical protein